MTDTPNPNSLSIALNPDGNVNITFPENEMVARFLVDKLRSLLDQEFARRAMLAQVQQNQNRVIPANGGGPIDLRDFKRGRG